MNFNLNSNFKFLFFKILKIDVKLPLAYYLQIDRQANQMDEI